ncbi:hypothetical protein [Haloterrigena alkaliphila]|uniref:C2H2-type domain-containing protein n=1 Tax=Haloterrigena alkaliphila TaxID=2816475 RepID=A0A8A2VEU0_9EURY|nr:hypothetical protein [Haloterrigena alkaliphila]QSW99230.1 hypothetical protein J0X25_17925 [Haloterrigena alkaliphila]
MAFQPPTECPICAETLDPDRTLEDHLRRAHPYDEVIQYVASQHEQTNAQPLS